MSGNRFITDSSLNPYRTELKDKRKQSKRKRLKKKSSQYSKRGCIQCKGAHLKCQEQRPICQHCKTYQKKCTYLDQFIITNYPTKSMINSNTETKLTSTTTTKATTTATTATNITQTPSSNTSLNQNTIKINTPERDGIKNSASKIKGNMILSSIENENENLTHNKLSTFKNNFKNSNKSNWLLKRNSQQGLVYRLKDPIITQNTVSFVPPRTSNNSIVNTTNTNDNFLKSPNIAYVNTSTHLATNSNFYQSEKKYKNNTKNLSNSSSTLLPNGTVNWGGITDIDILQPASSTSHSSVSSTYSSFDLDSSSNINSVTNLKSSNSSFLISTTPQNTSSKNIKTEVANINTLSVDSALDINLQNGTSYPVDDFIEFSSTGFFNEKNNIPNKLNQKVYFPKCSRFFSIDEMNIVNAAKIDPIIENLRYFNLNELSIIKECNRVYFFNLLDDKNKADVLYKVDPVKQWYEELQSTSNLEYNSYENHSLNYMSFSLNDEDLLDFSYKAFEIVSNEKLLNFLTPWSSKNQLPLIEYLKENIIYLKETFRYVTSCLMSYYYLKIKFEPILATIWDQQIRIPSLKILYHNLHQLALSAEPNFQKYLILGTCCGLLFLTNFRSDSQQWRHHFNELSNILQRSETICYKDKNITESEKVLLTPMLATKLIVEYLDIYSYLIYGKPYANDSISKLYRQLFGQNFNKSPFSINCELLLRIGYTLNTHLVLNKIVNYIQKLKKNEKIDISGINILRLMNANNDINSNTKENLNNFGTALLTMLKEPDKTNELYCLLDDSNVTPNDGRSLKAAQDIAYLTLRLYLKTFFIKNVSTAVVEDLTKAALNRWNSYENMGVEFIFYYWLLYINILVSSVLQNKKYYKSFLKLVDRYTSIGLPGSYELRKNIEPLKVFIEGG
ncbi:hypothetical protein TBLA_0E05030 [Henningerozyma blattae CBS 6284]|uniref:Zn(2)-C6 fungal-type domain-containing protein n=1 Tax=Henningerozyma blattae (strain ATCC 34711 / CBS 6284 / DSM 70876 / NBRC 10599 / NRRL Y-10934 / UCD 77-7) TaxID=1071380 RepID=I2H5A0_HENB6|nr:hypothetical protein TBLA_0E05030 [Tetrapisispora blattae CBS 6284]CCH61552.1 hypothetical protein TBLA_0E05030 [Tetrapisispora blattae CBS 6284]